MGAVAITPGSVWLLCDRPNLKAGGTDPFTAQRLWPQWWAGTDPFTAAKLRKAYRHGGALPWSMLREAVPAGFLPDPDGTAYYVTEVTGRENEWDGIDPYWPQFAHTAWGWTTDAPPPGEDPPPYTFTPNPALLDFLGVAEASRPKRLLRPGHPVPSADDEYGFIYLGSALPPVNALHHGPTATAVAGLMRRMQLVKAGVGSPSSDTLGAQVQYFARVVGGPGQTYGMPGDLWFEMTFGGGNWTVLSPPLPYCWTFAVMHHGWLYSPTITPETGCVADALGMPEGAVFDITGNACFVKGDPTTYPAHATAITWPTGVRKLLGQQYAPPGIGGPDSNAPKLMWRAAPAWRCFQRLEGKGTTGWWNAVLPPFYDTSGPIYNGYEYERPFLFRGYSHEMQAGAIGGSGGWNVLATFPSWDGVNLGDGVLGATLPTPGQEIIVTGYHPYMAAFGPEQGADMHATLYPQPTAPRVAVPVLHGGVIQGALP